MKSRIVLYLLGVQKVDGGGRKKPQKIQSKVNSSNSSCFTSKLPEKCPSGFEELWESFLDLQNSLTRPENL